MLAYLAIALGVVAAREMTCWALVGPWGGWAVPAPQDGARGSLGRTQMGQLVAATAGTGRGMDWAREARVAQTTLCSASGSRCPLTLVARRRLACLLLEAGLPESRTYQGKAGRKTKPRGEALRYLFRPGGC